ncbi:hypothetical protein SUGI_1184970 [Cryptomeria japonica]|nr:hypothetical protein SUGI_1184970 [Cryptomeria japonica]
MRNLRRLKGNIKSTKVKRKRKAKAKKDKDGEREGNKARQQRGRGPRDKGRSRVSNRCRHSDLPGCIHSEEKRSYTLFRGIFKNFKNSFVWRNIKDMTAKKSEMSCAFCNSDGTWDMLTTFYLRKSFEYHEDGESIVRPYVSENGLAAGAWMDR